MILVLIFLVIIITLLIIILLSNLKINIKKLKISNEVKNESIIKDFEIAIGIYLFNQIKIFSKTIEKEDLKNSKQLKNLKSKLVNQVGLKEKREDLKNSVSIIKKLKLNLQELELDISLGTEDVVLTSFLICIISTLFSIILAKLIRKYDAKKYKYKFTPLYNNQNLIDINFKGIIDMKLVNIINILFDLLFRRFKNYERTSNRRTYANSHE